MNRQSSLWSLLVAAVLLVGALAWDWLGAVPATTTEVASAAASVDSDDVALGVSQQHGAEGGDGAHGDSHEAPHKSTLEMSDADFFQEQFSHMVPHPDHGLHALNEKLPESLQIYNVNKYQWIALGLMLIVFLVVRFNVHRARPGWFVRVFRGWVLWVRDEMVYAVMGKEEGRRFAPYFIFLFFFLAFMNVVGLIPGIGGAFLGATATADFHVTGALAIVTLLMMVLLGSAKQGAVQFWVNLLPHGIPLWMVPLMAVVELVGLLVKPFALMVRLFANMLAGHLVIYSFIGLIFVFVKMFEASILSYATLVPFLGLAIFINILEAFITLLQAYIFTYLSILFVHQAMHPAH